MQRPGQNLTEFILPLSLVGILGIMALTTLGNQVSGLFTGVVSHKPPQASAASQGLNPALQQFMVNGVAFPQLPQVSKTLRLGNGKELTVSMASPVAAAETAGSKGVTINAIAAMQQILNKLIAEGAPEAQISELQKLIDQSKRIANLEGAIQAKFPPNGFANASEQYAFLKNNTIQWEGQTLSLLDATAVINYAPSDFFQSQAKYNLLMKQREDSTTRQQAAGTYTTVYKDNLTSDSGGNVINSFSQQLKRVEDSGLFRDNPELESFIEGDLALQISVSANQLIIVPTQAEAATLIQNATGTYNTSSGQPAVQEAPKANNTPRFDINSRAADTGALRARATRRG